jgi:hypothetical protein
MIKHNETDKGGSVSVKTKSGFADVSYSLSNKTNPLSVSFSVCKGSDAELSVCVMESVMEKHAPTVVLVESTDILTRFRPKLQSLFRCWTQGNQTVYAKAFASRSLFERVCSLSYAMQHTDFVKVNGDDIDLFGYYDVVKCLRENTKPFEFLALKEECDYTMKTCSVRCTTDMLERAAELLQHIPASGRGAFQEAVDRMSSNQLDERGRFDTKYSYIQEVVTGLLLPSMVKYGMENPFTTGLFHEFSKQASIYTESSEEFLENTNEIINGKYTSTDDPDTY